MSSLSDVIANLANLKFYTDYVTTNLSVTLPKGTYIFFISKSGYSQSSIWAIDGDGVSAFVNNAQVTLTKTTSGDNYVITWDKANFSRWLAVKLS